MISDDDDRDALDELLAEYGPPPKGPRGNKIDEIEDQIIAECRDAIAHVWELADACDELVAKNLTTRERANESLAAHAGRAKAEVGALLEMWPGRVVH